MPRQFVLGLAVAGALLADPASACSPVTTGTGAFVAGGSCNTASGDYTTVGGGDSNVAINDHSTIVGGQQGIAVGLHHGIAGGQSNAARGSYSFSGGGNLNFALAPHSTVGGGLQNYNIGQYAVIGGGDSNTARGEGSFIAGGADNSVSGDYSGALGSNGVVTHDESLVISVDSSCNSDADNAVSVCAPSGLFINGVDITTRRRQLMDSGVDRTAHAAALTAFEESTERLEKALAHNDDLQHKVERMEEHMSRVQSILAAKSL